MAVRVLYRTPFHARKLTIPMLVLPVLGHVMVVMTTMMMIKVMKTLRVVVLEVVVVVVMAVVVRVMW